MKRPWRDKQVIGTATLYLGDCREIISWLFDDMYQAGAVVTDPPYGIDYSHSGGGGHTRQGKRYGSRFANVKVEGDDRPFDPAHLLGVAPVLALFGANHYAHRLPIEEKQKWLIWDKGFAEVPGLTFSHVEMVWTNLIGASRLKKWVWNGFYRQGEFNHVPRAHPTQKPIGLMAWILEQIGNPASVLDPYMGSGTTGVACAQAGVGFTGVEIDERYFEAACERIEDATRQGVLFAPGGAQEG